MFSGQNCGIAPFHRVPLQKKKKKTVCNTSLITLSTDVVNWKSVHAILNLRALLVYYENRQRTTFIFSAKAFLRPKWADSQASKITQTVEKGYKFVYTLSDGWDIQLIIVCLACVINLANQGGSQSVGFNCKTHLLRGNSARCSTLRSGFEDVSFKTCKWTVVYIANRIGGLSASQENLFLPIFRF